MQPFFLFFKVPCYQRHKNSIQMDNALSWLDFLFQFEFICKYTLGKKGCYTPGWCVFFVIISISSVREV